MNKKTLLTCGGLLVLCPLLASNSPAYVYPIISDTENPYSVTLAKIGAKSSYGGVVSSYNYSLQIHNQSEKDFYVDEIDVGGANYESNALMHTLDLFIAANTYSPAIVITVNNNIAWADKGWDESYSVTLRGSVSKGEVAASYNSKAPTFVSGGDDIEKIYSLSIGYFNDKAPSEWHYGACFFSFNGKRISFPLHSDGTSAGMSSLAEDMKSSLIAFEKTEYYKKDPTEVRPANYRDYGSWIAIVICAIVGIVISGLVVLTVFWCRKARADKANTPSSQP